MIKEPPSSNPKYGDLKEEPVTKGCSNGGAIGI